MSRTLLILLGIVDLGAWYAFIYLWLFTIKNPVNLYVYAAILLILMIVAMAACPLLYYPASRKEDERNARDRTATPVEHTEDM